MAFRSCAVPAGSPQITLHLRYRCTPGSRVEIGSRRLIKIDKKMAPHIAGLPISKLEIAVVVAHVRSTCSQPSRLIRNQSQSSPISIGGDCGVYATSPAGQRVDTQWATAGSCDIKEDKAEKHRGLSLVEHREKPSEP